MRLLMFDCSVADWLGGWRAPICAAGVSLLASLAQAQWLDGDGDGAPLKSSGQLQQRIAPETRQALPSFIQGRQISGRPDLETVIEGEAELRKADMVIQADRLEYDLPTDTAKASGHVRINRAGNVYEGPLLELRVDAFEGFFTAPSYQFLRHQAHGQAERVEFIDAQHSVIHNATFTTCQRQPGPDWLPDWVLKATRLSLDQAEDTGTAQGALLSFKGLPLLPVPYLSFPLSDQRKSGYLAPTFGIDNVNGSEIAVPYYWNIAPNRDATFTPTLMSNRGINLASELRYLEADYSGAARLDLMPADNLRDNSRWGLNLKHQGHLKSGWTEHGVALNLNLNRVSDDNYWRDFSRTDGSLTQRLLAADATLSWSNGPFATTLRTLQWQTLQDASAPIIPPFDRLPQLATRYVFGGWQGTNLSVDADYTYFASDHSLTGQPNGQRLFSMLQVSRPWQLPGGFITPKLQLHASNYQLDTALATGESGFTRVLPTLSIDSGLVFERDTTLLGRHLRQTLEPRAFYVNTPYRDQHLLPVYDSGARDFNLSTIYSENDFVGSDRISDSKLLTLGVTSRFLSPDSGAELVRVGVAQRLRFQDQRVTLPGGTPVTDRISDVLLGSSIHWDPRWGFDAAVQFNPHNGESVRSTLSGRYSPGSYRTLSLAYRFQRDSSEQLDLGWQWPLNDLWGDRGQSAATGQGQGSGRWYSVGRLNYSMVDRKLVDSLVGFEYDAGCWLGRIVLERLQTSTVTATERIMFQLEFVGFSRLGVNPLKSLQGNIPNYQTLRTPTGTPSRFSNYD